MRYTGDRRTGRLLGVQLVGHRNAEIAKRIDIPATAIFNELTVEQLSELDLSYTPPLGSPWDAIQIGAQEWSRHARRSTTRPGFQRSLSSESRCSRDPDRPRASARRCPIPG